METLFSFFRSVLEQDTAAVVLCDLEHTIRYMNPAAAANYSKWGGAALLGKNLLDCHDPHSVEAIRKVVDWFAADTTHNKVYTFYNEQQNKDVYMIALRDENGCLIGYYEKHEYRNRETMKRYDLY